LLEIEKDAARRDCACFLGLAKHFCDPDISRDPDPCVARCVRRAAHLLGAKGIVKFPRALTG